MEFIKVTSKEGLENLIEKVTIAQKKYSSYSQKKVDEIFKNAAIEANKQRIELAKKAVQETKMGVFEDKITKNHYAAEIIFNKYKDTKTCGILEEDCSFGIKKIADPIGLIAGVIPTTNPTSTVIFKALLALKTRNAIIFSPHPRAKECTVAAAKVILKAAIDAGAPDFIIGWIDEPTIELTQHLMQHPSISMTLATGGGAMVKSAYCSGKPAIGVGAGNTPVVIDETADIKMAVSSILLSKTFDNGLICSSEQSVIVVEEKYEELKAEFNKRGAYILSKGEKDKLAQTLFPEGKLNSDVIGNIAKYIAEAAKIKVPEDTKVLMVPTELIGEKEVFSREKLSPVLALYKANDFKDAVDKAFQLLQFAGIGHTSVLYTDAMNTERINEYGLKIHTARVLINQPAAHGAIGDLFNFKLEPSLTLGCGSWGGNSISENIGVKHLLNIKTVAERRENMLWFKVPPKVYFKSGSLGVALTDLAGKKRAFIVTDKMLNDLGYTKKVTNILQEIGVDYEIFFDVEPNPSIATVNRGLAIIKSYKPDVIIALGGGSPIDAAKIMWLMYESPEQKFEELALRFMDIKKRICTFPEMGKKSIMVAIPTTSGTGSEVTPFSVITDEKTDIKYPIADYELTPTMAIVDPELVMSMPKSLAAFSGLDALVHAIEAMASICATEYTNGLSLEAIRLVFKYLPASYKNGAKDPKAREKMHYASTIAGMAFANAFLGICHSMAHKLGAAFDIPHGLANILLISQVIKYNAVDVPVKQAAFSQYKYPTAKESYARIADYLGLGGKSLDDKVNKLVEAIEKLKKELNIPVSIQEAGISESDFYNKLDELSLLAYDDQCTGANPRYPLIIELKDLYLAAFNGKIDV